MFSERWICFCCPHAYKTQRSVVPLGQQQSQPPSKSAKKKKSDISKFAVLQLFLISINKYLFIALSSVIIIQSWFRKRQAVLEMRRKTAWTIYQNIEYSGEQDQLKVIIQLN